MKYCTNCLQPDTRPNTFFNEFGICPACEFSTKENSLQWEKPKYDLSLQSFQDYIKPFLTERDGYNCCLGVSGGKDSTRQALFARDVLGLRPKLICLAFPPELLTVTGAVNLSNLSKLGFQIDVFSPGPYDWQRLMKYAFINFGNPLVPTELALYSSVPKFAIRAGLKLILWGENPALQLGDMNTLGNHPFDGDSLRKTNTLRNTDVTWMKKVKPTIENIDPYTYPESKLYSSSALKTIFMGPVMKDWSLLNNSKFAGLHGIDMRYEKPEFIGDTYGVTALDQHITPLNQVIKYLKYGFGRMTDYMNEEIRLNRITRTEAIAIVEKYDGKCSKGYFRRFAKYLEMNYDSFWDVIDSYVNRDLFERVSIDQYIPKFKVGFGIHQ